MRACVVCALLLAPLGVAGQATDREPGPSFGVGITSGIGTLPSDLFSRSQPVGSDLGWAAGVRAWAPLGTDFFFQVDLVAHASIQSLGPPRHGQETTLEPAGEVVDHVPLGGANRIMTVAARIGHPFGDRLQYRAAAGLSRIPSQGTTSISLEAGYRFGEQEVGAARLGLDVGLHGFQVPYERRIHGEYDPALQRYPILDTERVHFGRFGLSLRLTAEVPVRPGS